MTFPETIQYLESFINYEKIPVYSYKESLKLERVKDFLSSIGSPQDSLRCIHVAGSKGKGSTCAFVAYVLRQTRHRVGLYTSPHLSDFRERIRVLEFATQKSGKEFEGMIPESRLAGLVERLKPDIETFSNNSEFGPLSFFEVYTAIAFSYFKEENIDFAVLETGLGGRLDATNVANPLVCAITPISYEHTQKLGNTLREIAAEKAGIIKRDTIVISAPQEEEAAEAIRVKCKETNAKLYEVGKDITYKKTKNGFNVKGFIAEFTDLKINLLGPHQLVNAAVAIGVIEALCSYGIDIRPDSIKRGLYNTVWPGRCEVVREKPLIVLDGAQNTASASVLRGTIQDNFKYKKLILILGVSSDKDKEGICAKLYDLADKIILTRADNPRAAEPEVLAGYFKGKDTFITGDVAEAKELASRLAGEEDLILVTGSLFVVGEIRQILYA